MATSTKWRVFLLCTLCLSSNISKVIASQDVITKMSVTFFTIIQECQKEMSVSDDNVKKLLNFWHESQELSRELGCVLICLAKKHGLIESNEYKMHKDNTYQFALSHGADVETAKEIMKIMGDCEKKFDDTKDICDRVVHVALCFRSHMHSIKWSPPVDFLEDIAVDH